MKYTYTEFLDILDWELQQEKQGGDTAQADKFRFLPHTQALRVLNETMRELAMVSPDQFEREYIYTFVESGTVKTLTLPEFILKAVSWWDETEERWKVIGDSSDLTSTIVSTSSDTIYNSDGWSQFDEIKLKVVALPPTVKTTAYTATEDSYDGKKVIVGYGEAGYWDIGDLLDVNYGDRTSPAYLNQKDSAVTIWLDREPETSIVNITNNIKIQFPEKYTRLLILEIKRKAYSRKGKALSPYEFSELMKLKQQWSEESSPVQHKARIAFEGYGLGR